MRFDSEITCEDEAWLKIFEYLTPEEWVFYSAVSKRWHFLLAWPLLWCKVQSLNELDQLSYWDDLDEEPAAIITETSRHRVFLLRLFAVLCRKAGPYLESAKLELSEYANSARNPILTCLVTHCPGIHDLEIRINEATFQLCKHELIRNIPNFSISLESLWLDFVEITANPGEGSFIFEQLFFEIGKLGRLSRLHVSIGASAAFRLRLNDDSLARAGLVFWSTIEKSPFSLTSLSLNIPLHSFMEQVKPHKLCSSLCRMRKLQLLSLLCPFEFAASLGELFTSIHSVQHLATSLHLTNRHLNCALRKMSNLKKLAIMTLHCITTGGLESAICDRPKTFPKLLIYFKQPPLTHPRALGSYDQSKTAIWFENDLLELEPNPPVRNTKSRWESRIRQFILHEGIFNDED